MIFPTTYNYSHYRPTINHHTDTHTVIILIIITYYKHTHIHTVMVIITSYDCSPKHTERDSHYTQTINHQPSHRRQIKMKCNHDQYVLSCFPHCKLQIHMYQLHHHQSQIHTFIIPMHQLQSFLHSLSFPPLLFPPTRIPPSPFTYYLIYFYLFPVSHFLFPNSKFPNPNTIA